MLVCAVDRSWQLSIQVIEYVSDLSEEIAHMQVTKTRVLNKKIQPIRILQN